MKWSMGARAQAWALLALVATSGALAGVVGDRLLSERTSSSVGAPDAPPASAPAGPWRWEARPDAMYAQRLAESLSLTTEQETAINDIVAEEQVRVQELTQEVQPRFRAIAEETRGRIEAVLSPAQQQRLRELRQERMRGPAPRNGPRAGPGRPGPGRGAAMLDSVARARRDSIMTERREELSRERPALMREFRERRDSIMRQLRNLPPEVRDSILLELRDGQAAWRDSVWRERQQRMRARPGARDSLRSEEAGPTMFEG